MFKSGLKTKFIDARNEAGALVSPNDITLNSKSPKWAEKAIL